MIDALVTLKEAYENEGMSLSEIAEDQEMELSVVKAGLIQCSAKYRKECGLEARTGEDIEEESANFTKEQNAEVVREIYNLALSTEDEHVKKDLLKFIRNDYKGRLNPVKNMQHSGVNILQINMALQGAKRGASEAKKLVEV